MGFETCCYGLYRILRESCTQFLKGPTSNQGVSKLDTDQDPQHSHREETDQLAGIGSGENGSLQREVLTQPANSELQHVQCNQLQQHDSGNNNGCTSTTAQTTTNQELCEHNLDQAPSVAFKQVAPVPDKYLEEIQEALHDQPMVRSGAAVQDCRKHVDGSQNIAVLSQHVPTDGNGPVPITTLAHATAVDARPRPSGLCGSGQMSDSPAPSEMQALQSAAIAACRPQSRQPSANAPAECSQPTTAKDTTSDQGQRGAAAAPAQPQPRNGQTQPALQQSAHSVKRARRRPRIIKFVALKGTGMSLEEMARDKSKVLPLESSAKVTPPASKAHEVPVETALAKHGPLQPSDSMPGPMPGQGQHAVSAGLTPAQSGHRATVAPRHGSRAADGMAHPTPCAHMAPPRHARAHDATSGDDIAHIGMKHRPMEKARTTADGGGNSRTGDLRGGARARSPVGARSAGKRQRVGAGSREDAIDLRRPLHMPTAPPAPASVGALPGTSRARKQPPPAPAAAPWPAPPFLGSPLLLVDDDSDDGGLPQPPHKIGMGDSIAGARERLQRAPVGKAPPRLLVVEESDEDAVALEVTGAGVLPSQRPASGAHPATAVLPEQHPARATAAEPHSVAECLQDGLTTAELEQAETMWCDERLTYPRECQLDQLAAAAGASYDSLLDACKVYVRGCVFCTRPHPKMKGYCERVKHMSPSQKKLWRLLTAQRCRIQAQRGGK